MPMHWLLGARCVRYPKLRKNVDANAKVKQDWVTTPTKKAVRKRQDNAEQDKNRKMVMMGDGRG